LDINSNINSVLTDRFPEGIALSVTFESASWAKILILAPALERGLLHL
jgi:hypothetical protein